MEENVEVQLETEEVMQPKSRRPVLWVGIASLLVFMVAAAFIGGRFLNRPAGGASGSGGPGAMSLGVKGPGGQKTVNIDQSDIIPAKELPATEPDTRGIFTRRSDNSYFIGTGNVRIMGKADPNGQVSLDAEYDGSEVEVVVTNDTKVYRDVTWAQDEMPEEGKKYQQKVTTGSLDEVDQYSDLTVWGRKAGDRYIADVILYSLPPVMNKALPNK